VGEAGRRRITIAGAGPGGICTAIKLKQAGIEDFVILERSGRVGGTWARNRYPGLACDVHSMLYSFTFEQKVDWTRSFATQPEIEQYMRHCVEKYDLGPHIRFDADLREARWDDDACAWRLSTADGRSTGSDVLVAAIGMFNALRRPDIPGLDDFAGRTVHSGAWPDDGVDLDGRRVAVIGSAASAVQMIPELAGRAAALTVFQRTANWVFPKPDERYSDEQIEERRRDPALGLAIRREFTEFFEALITYDRTDLIDDLMVKGLENLAAVEDPVTREKLRPLLPFGAQRPLNSNTYYPTFNREHVRLVTDPIASISPRGVVTEDGVEHEADVLVLATGYEANRFLSVIEVAGRAGVRLADVWRDGPHAYKGMAIAGFPNLFMLYGPNTNAGCILEMLEMQADYVIDRIGRLEREGADWIEVRAEAMEAYNETLQRDIAAVGAWRTVGSRYYRAPSGRIVTQYPGNMASFRQLTAAADEDAYDIGLAPALEQREIA
jgi:cation diffusion facilitator CzcD-associated flavoprotein CzcO